MENRLFTTGLNIVQCEFEEDLFEHYVLEDIETENALIDPNWVQLMVSQITMPNVQCHVSDGILVFVNTKTLEIVQVPQHQLVEQATDVLFITLPNQLMKQLKGN